MIGRRTTPKELRRSRQFNMKSPTCDVTNPPLATDRQGSATSVIESTIWTDYECFIG